MLQRVHQLSGPDLTEKKSDFINQKKKNERKKKRTDDKMKSDQLTA